ncbi:MAG: HAD family hydrolase [Lawsonibacter sp.]
MLHLDGVVFDVDGVLFDTERLSRSVWEEVSQEFGCPQAVEHYLEFIGRSRRDDMAHMLELLGSKFPVEAFFQTCSQRTQARIEADGVPLKPGVFEILTFLTERRLPIALATSTYSERTSRRLELTGLGPFFQTVVTGDQVTHGKPHPEIYQTACGRLGIDTASALAVEDSFNGIHSAHGAGMRVAMIPDLIPPTPELDQLLFQRFESLLELRDFLADSL